ncbi:hypothetical protein [Chryseobacterium sp.]|uniref:hypothetical protein n=1 Tax=Chryseobacterium sp. TaxID=1871047 RepID=UPI00321B81B6
MKKLSLFLFLLLSFIKVSACKCVMNTFAENYLSADVVGVIKILKVYDENTEQRTYKADVEFEKVYKGTKFTTLNVRGLIGQSYSGACETQVTPDERYLVLLNGYNNNYTINSCSPMSRLNVQPTKDEDIQLETLSKAFSYLDENKNILKGLKFVSHYDDSKAMNSRSDLSKINHFKPKQLFAIYKITAREDSRIEKITPVTGFGSQEKAINNALKGRIIIGTKNSEQKEYLLLLFYHKENLNSEFDEVISKRW